MSCVLRLSTRNLDACLLKISVAPYRVERGTAHFLVSAADFDNFAGQIDDAIAFLNKHGSGVESLLAQPDAYGVLDFAVELREADFQSNVFPATMVREAGKLGLALELSLYPGEGNSP